MRRLLLFSLAILTSFLIAGCGSKEYAIKVDDNLKSKEVSDNFRTYYQIFVGSFSDSNKDGTGDLKGIINRLDYLNDGKPDSGLSLGVDGIWLSPIMRSTSYHKYDVIDYKSIDNSFGTIDDFKELIKECNKRGINVIIDLVLNHTSDWHPWFREATNAIKQNDFSNKYINYYEIKQSSDKNPGSTYYQIGSTDYYYEGNFSSTMPELNMDNEEVKEEIIDIIKFWFDLGVTGFRLDAVKYIYLGYDAKNYQFWNWFMEEVKKIKSDAYVVGEAWSADAAIIPYYQNFSCFDFGMSQLQGYITQTAYVNYSVSDYTKYIEGYLKKISEYTNNINLSPFIANHDMDRAAGYLSVDEYFMQMAANLYMLSPGSPYIYYGEEIGMKGSRGSENTDANRRLAMLWGDKDSIKDPIGSTYDKKSQVNGTVSSQIKDSNSLYNHYKKLILLRNANPEIARGVYTPIIVEDKKTFGGFISTYEGSKVIVLHNTGANELIVDLSDYTSETISIIRGIVGKGSASLDGMTLTIGPMTTVVLK
ncbi:hypothetical protein LJC17_02610 [Acholeplasma sp. OttesenSCG-928-E16]|nr:hypothetical protein [Acholeplasma sp. OttesenSCG-928-E16]